METIRVIDSHTGGEPTRVVIEGGPDLGAGNIAVRQRRFVAEFDRYRSAIINEPRGSDVLVGALLVPPTDPECVAGVLFFNNVGSLGMCGHGMIGVVATLAYMGRLGVGEYQVETAVGKVGVRLLGDGSVTIANVASHRRAKGVTVDVAGHGPVTGDVAWGGNWFFLVESPGLKIERATVDALTDFCWRLRQAVNGGGYPEVDHIELFGPPTIPGADSKNFVLCPGKAWDRSPCGTGTSAKLACLAEDGLLGEGELWVQESVIGSCFTGQYRRIDGKILPTISGSAWVCGETMLILDERDPFRWGIV
jgi:4-hydroxyproline epimerase